jgi:transcriptional regulator with XRE-family HTH domain|nr:helix-turn-helix transcriptional regulator [Heyndrickxia oleronia]
MKMIAVNVLAQTIRSKNYTQAQFAEKLGTDQSTVSKICKQKSFTLERLQQILEALDETDTNKVIRVIEIKE